MKRHLLGMVVSFAALACFAVGCGGTSSSSGGGSSTTATASVDSLASIPSVDLSTYDSSESAASANVAALLTKGLSKSLTKGMGEDLNAVGNASRAGCEANMHKKEVIRNSQIAQLERCYPEAMEIAGFIPAIGDSYAYYAISPPEESAEDVAMKCDGIPEEFVDKKDACEAEGGKGGKDMKMRIGKINGALHIDMCEEALVNEATYTANGSQYTASIVHIGNWMGNPESSSFDMIVDLGIDGSVIDGIVDLGTDGTLTATSNMDGGNGSGKLFFEAIAADASNKVYGAFSGGFTDPMTNTATSFKGKTYARFGGALNTGCAKYSFSGTMPPMRLIDMVPFDISEANKDEFIKGFCADLGIALGPEMEPCSITNAAEVYLCPNGNFDPEVEDPTIKPMIALSGGGQCPSVENTGIECYAITNIESEGDFGTEVSQAFTIIADDASPYHAEVAAYVIGDLSEAFTAPAFTRNWDCTGSFTTINFQGFTEEQMAKAETAMQKCFELEEKANANNGMGDYNCGEQQQMNGVDDYADDGGTDVGLFGGEYGYDATGVHTCVADPSTGRLFVDALNVDEGKYCVSGNGLCKQFTVVGTVGTPGDDPILLGPIESGIVVQRFDYNSATDPTTVVATLRFGDQPPCQEAYRIEKHNWDAPPEFGGEGEGQAPGEAGFIPAACINPDGTPIPGSACQQKCMEPGANCAM